MRNAFLRWFRVASFAALLGVSAIYGVIIIVHLATGHGADHAKTDMYLFFTPGIFACFLLAPGTNRSQDSYTSSSED